MQHRFRYVVELLAVAPTGRPLRKGSSKGTPSVSTTPNPADGSSADATTAATTVAGGFGPTSWTP